MRIASGRSPWPVREKGTEGAPRLVPRSVFELSDSRCHAAYHGVVTLVLAWYSKLGATDVLHVATDSLLSESGTANAWPHASKLFRVHPSHSYIAYCGDSLYGLSAVAQGIGLLSSTEILHDERTTVKARARALGDHMARVFKTFPSNWGNAATLLFCGRDPIVGGVRAMKVSLVGGNCQVTEAIPSGHRYVALGSGATFASKYLSQVDATHSRQVFSVLTAAIRDPSEASVGGCPQAATLFCYRRDPSRGGSSPSGFNWETGPHLESTLFGVPLRFASRMSKVVWRTSAFTRDRYLREARVRRVGW